MIFPPFVACLFIVLFGGACFCAGVVVGMTSMWDDWMARMEEARRRSRKQKVQREGLAVKTPLARRRQVVYWQHETYNPGDPADWWKK